MANHAGSISCLKRANLADISQPDNWLWLARAYASSGEFVMANQCLNQHQRLAPDHGHYSDLLGAIQAAPSHNSSQFKLKQQLEQRLLPTASS